MTAGGGVRAVDDVRGLLRSGADVPVIASGGYGGAAHLRSVVDAAASAVAFAGALYYRRT